MRQKSYLSPLEDFAGRNRTLHLFYNHAKRHVHYLSIPESRLAGLRHMRIYENAPSKRQTLYICCPTQKCPA